MQLFGIICDDRVNRYNERVTLSALLDMCMKQWRDILPLTYNHDRTKVLGYSRIAGILIQPNKATLTSSFFIPETAQECEEAKRVLTGIANHLDTTEYDRFRDMLGTYIEGDYLYYDSNSVAIYNPGIVSRLFPSLISKFDDDGLIKLSQLSTVSPGVYRIDKYLIFAHHFFRRNLSFSNTLNTPFLSELEDFLKNNPDTIPKIKIDLDMVGLAGSESQYREYAYWWGPKFNDDMASIPLGLSHFENEKYDSFSSPVRFTECGWYNQDERKTFECEEIIDTENIENYGEVRYGCRYVHSMLNSDNLAIHLDGAIRGYTIEKMLMRLEQKMTEAKRDTSYTKLWRIDGIVPIHEWKKLITHYYRDNYLIGEYFGGKDGQYDRKQHVQEHKTTKLTLSDFVPIDFSPKDGLQSYISFREYIDTDNQDVIILPSQYMTMGKREAYIEEFTETFVKYVQRNGVSINIPPVMKLAFFSDMNINLPVFICNSSRIANVLLKCLCDFCTIWINHDQNRQMSFSIGINYGNECVLFSFAGHICTINDCYNSSSLLFPEDKNDLCNWANRLYTFINPKYITTKEVHLHDIIYHGRLMIPRRPILKDSELKKDDDGLLMSMALTKEEYAIISENNVSVSECIEIISQKCEKCNKEYSTCDCVKYIDEDCKTQILEANDRGAYWILHNAYCN